MFTKRQMCLSVRTNEQANTRKRWSVETPNTQRSHAFVVQERTIQVKMSEETKSKSSKTSSSCEKTSDRYASRHHVSRRDETSRRHETKVLDASDYNDEETDEERRVSRKKRHEADCPHSDTGAQCKERRDRSERTRNNCKESLERYPSKQHRDSETPEKRRSSVERRSKRRDEETERDATKRRDYESERRRSKRDKEGRREGWEREERRREKRSEESSSRRKERKHHRGGERSHKRHHSRKVQQETTETSNTTISTTQDSTRLYYSDSELEVSQVKKQQQPSYQQKTRKPSLAIDVDAIYNLFYRDHHDESQVIKEAMVKKMTGADKRLPPLPPIKIVSSKEKEAKNNAQTAEEKFRTALEDESSVRCKLIRVLFQRVKELLRETEVLRGERKQLQETIATLQQQVEQLKVTDKETKGSVAQQEKKINDRLEVLADEMKLTVKGSTFRDEIHNILHSIQSKYQTHWKEHESKIQEVQTSAENEIQTLMKSIVGKYVQLAEMKGRAAGPREFARNEHDQYAMPLYIDVKEKSPGEQKFSADELLLKALDEGYVKKNFQRQSSEITTAKPPPDQPLHIDIPKFDPTPLQHEASRKITAAKDYYTRMIYNTDSNEAPRNSKPLEIPEAKSEFSSGISETIQKILSKRELSALTRDTPQQTEPQQSENPDWRMSSKEFWRHKLLQPNPIETLKNENKEIGNVRNTC